MAQIFTVNVYEVNQAAVPTVALKGFPSAQCMLSPYNGSNSSLYGLITTIPDGKTYATVQSVTALAALANA